MPEMLTPYQIKLWDCHENYFPEDEDYTGWGTGVAVAEDSEDEISLDELEDEEWEEEDDLEEI